MGHGMPSFPFDDKHDRTTSGLTCHHRATHTIERRRAWHAIIAFGQQTRSNDIGRGMPSSPLGSTDGRTMSGVACHHRHLVAHTVERRRAWHAIIAFVKHTRSNNVGQGMTSPPLDSTHSRQLLAWHGITALGQYTRSDNVGRGMTSLPLDCMHNRMTSSVT